MESIRVGLQGVTPGSGTSLGEGVRTPIPVQSSQSHTREGGRKVTVRELVSRVERSGRPQT